jgi:antirestriction protein ArdC
VRERINNRILNYVKNTQIPWQKPWVGWGEGVGFPKNVYTKEKYFGVNVILLQMAARENRFVSCWWGTAEQFAAVGGKVSGEPTEILLYRTDVSSNKSLSTPILVYNHDQLQNKLKGFSPNPVMVPNYSLVDKVLQSTRAKVVYNDIGEAWYYYPPHDYITLPEKHYFEEGLGGLPGFYDSLAHELTHWSESRLGFDSYNETARELRAEMGASFLMEELHCPHSISYSNFNKWKNYWIHLLQKDNNAIFKVAASACRAADYIMSFSMKVEQRFNSISESVA